MRLFLLLLTGCAYPGIEDRWADTVSVCDPPQPYVDDPTVYDTSWITEDCQARIVEDFGVDSSTFNQDQLDCFLLGAINLMARDLGDFQDLEVDDYVRRPFLHELAKVRRALPEGDEVARLAYDFAAVHVDETRIVDDLEERGATAAYQQELRLLKLSPQNTAACSTSYATTLVHEASHAVVPDHIPCPWDPSVDCDKTWHSAYGVEASMAQVMLLRADPVGDRGAPAALFSRTLAAGVVLHN